MIPKIHLLMIMKQFELNKRELHLIYIIFVFFIMKYCGQVCIIFGD